MISLARDNVGSELAGSLRLKIMGTMLATTVLLAGCGGTETESLAETSGPSATEAAPGTSAPAAAETTEQQPSTTNASGPMLDTINGGQLDLGEVLGQDAVLWFWAPW